MKDAFLVKPHHRHTVWLKQPLAVCPPLSKGEGVVGDILDKKQVFHYKALQVLTPLSFGEGQGVRLKNMEHLKYPIGKFEYGKNYTMQDNINHIADIEKFAEDLKALVSKFDSSLLENSYRPDGWTARQIIHHPCG